jgi:hypothetical protein
MISCSKSEDDDGKEYMGRKGFIVVNSLLIVLLLQLVSKIILEVVRK